MYLLFLFFCKWNLWIYLYLFLLFIHFNKLWFLFRLGQILYTLEKLVFVISSLMLLSNGMKWGYIIVSINIPLIFHPACARCSHDVQTELHCCVPPWCAIFNIISPTYSWVTNYCPTFINIWGSSHSTSHVLNPTLCRLFLPI